jgi:stage III sporulation protein AH
MKLWKRNAVVAAIVLFVCVAVYLNWSYQQDEVDAGKTLGQTALVGGRTNDPLLPAASAAPAESAGPDEAAKPTTGYFSTARLNRQQARDSALGMLQETLNSDASEEAAKADAGAAIETLAASTVSEAQIENLVVAKGYTDCVAFISEGGVSVVVSSDGQGLQDADVARITEIVMDETGVPASQIKIIGAEG